MGCGAIRELEKAIIRQQIINSALIGILFAVNIIWLCVYIHSQKEFEYTVETKTEVIEETVIEQDSDGNNVAVLGDGNTIGGTYGTENR